MSIESAKSPAHPLSVPVRSGGPLGRISPRGPPDGAADLAASAPQLPGTTAPREAAIKELLLALEAPVLWPAAVPEFESYSDVHAAARHLQAKWQLAVSVGGDGV